MLAVSLTGAMSQLASGVSSVVHEYKITCYSAYMTMLEYIDTVHLGMLVYHSRMALPNSTCMI